VISYGKRRKPLGLGEGATNYANAPAFIKYLHYLGKIDVFGNIHFKALDTAKSL
jgi:hypothetical protein